MDVKSAFIHGEIYKEIYIQQHKGFQEDPSLVCRLKKSLYAPSKPQGLGMPRWTIFCYHMDLLDASLILMFICSILVMYFSSLYSIFMTF